MQFGTDALHLIGEGALLTAQSLSDGTVGDFVVSHPHGDNKARVARIIDNSRYIGSDEFEPIIEEEVFEEAAAAKIARQRNRAGKDSEAIALRAVHHGPLPDGQ